MTGTPAQAAKELDARLSDVATALYTVDSAGDVLFARAQADAGSRPAAASIASLTVAWEQYPLVKEAVEWLHEGLANGDHQVVTDLLGPAGVTLPDGTTAALATVLADLRHRIDTVARDVGRLADAARHALAQLDAARAAADEIVVRAGAVGAADDPEVTALRAALARATAAIAADPTSDADLTAVGELKKVALERVEQLERRRQELPAALVAAHRDLDEIEALAARGADSLALAEAKIASPTGVLPPLDPRAEGDQSLRPSLERIQQHADTGAWEAAAVALEAWRKTADGWHARVRQVAEANAAPVARRNELRGLLDAYRAKALAYGRDEDGRLARLHASAKEVLYTAPCVLDEAERLVQEYLTAVNDAAGGREG